MHPTTQTIIKDWIFALRSGYYTPIRNSGGFIHDKKCCAIGVLGKALGVGDSTLYGLVNSRGAAEKLRGKIFLMKANLTNFEFQEINDAFENGCSYEEIADYLELKYLQPATEEACHSKTS